MSDTQILPPILLDLFRELLASNVPLGVQDYIDGLRALQLGFGNGNRQQLCKLAQVLWARSDEERRLISRYLGEIPLPHEDITATLENMMLNSEIELPTENIKFKTTKNNDSSSAVPNAFSNTLDTKSEPISEQSRHRARISFSDASGNEGLSLPNLDATPTINEIYTLHSEELFKSRDLAVLWRRYRRATRQGPRVEFDLNATIRKRCQDGILCSPVLRPKRMNSARLLVLADASPSMAPWYSFISTLENSLRFSQFACAEILYFNNLPRKNLFKTIDRSKPLLTQEVLRCYAGASLMIISDAGCSRGYLNKRRAANAEDFLEIAKRQFSNVVWINPMPSERWASTTASLLANSIQMLPLDPKHMLRAIDLLRGNK
jgi:uncharacterized protein with von Willebrand factor type A (vWA) domain